MVRTSAFQAGNRGSTPRRVTTSLLKDKSFAVQAQDGKLANKKLTLRSGDLAKQSEVGYVLCLHIKKCKN